MDTQFLTFGRKQEDTLLIDPEVDIVIDDVYVSPRHATIRREWAADQRIFYYLIMDLASTNGTYIVSPKGVCITVPIGSYQTIPRHYSIMLGRTIIPWGTIK